MNKEKIMAVLGIVLLFVGALVASFYILATATHHDVLSEEIINLSVPVNN